VSHDAASAVGSVIDSFAFGFQFLKVVPSISIDPVHESGL
jgi:hypothetical protein